MSRLDEGRARINTLANLGLLHPSFRGVERDPFGRPIAPRSAARQRQSRPREAPFGWIVAALKAEGLEVQACDGGMPVGERVRVKDPIWMGDAEQGRLTGPILLMVPEGAYVDHVRWSYGSDSLVTRCPRREQVTGAKTFIINDWTWG